MLTIRDLLSATQQRLLGSSDSAELDGELLLAHVLNISRASLYTWPEKIIHHKTANELDILVCRRLKGEPMAYLLGNREFYNLRLKVNHHTLIARPETEHLVDAVLSLNFPENTQLLELGTGSGAIAIAIALAEPTWQILAVDNDSKTLAVARENGVTHQAKNVHWVLSDWFQKIKSTRFNIIVSNPPYLAETDPYLQQGDLRFEPRAALCSGPAGLDALQWICRHAPDYLLPKGMILLEHGYNQAEAVQAYLAKFGFSELKTIKDYAGIERIAVGCFYG